MQLGGAILGKPFAASLKTVSGVCQGKRGRWESRVSWGTSAVLHLVRQQSLLPVYTGGLHSAWALVSRTLWPTCGSLPCWGLYSRTGLGTQGHSQPLLQGYLAGQVPADVNFQVPWHGCVTSQAPLPKTAALCSQFPHVWPGSLYHLTGSE